MKRIKFLAEYTPDELSPIFNSFQKFAWNNVFFDYVYVGKFLIEHQKERLKFIKENQIDVFRTGAELFNNFSTDIFADLSDVVDINKISKPYLDSCYKENKLIALPDTIDGLLLWHNKKVLQDLKLEVPQTWESFLSVLRNIKFQRPDLIPFALHNLKELKGWWSYYLFQPFLAQAGIDFNENIDVNTFMDKLEVKETLKFFKTMIDEKLLGILDEPAFRSVANIAFVQEKAVFIHEGPWSVTTVININPTLIQHIGFSVLGNKKKTTILGGTRFGILSSNQNIELTKSFLKSMTKEGNYYDLLVNQYKIPAYDTGRDLSPFAKEINDLFINYGEMEVIHNNETEIAITLGNKLGTELQSML